MRQVALFAAAYMAYRIARGLLDGNAHVAFENARMLLDVERAMGLFFEPALQSWALGASWLVAGASWLYVNTHFAITTGFLLWLYFARNRSFYLVRNAFVVAMTLALFGYVAFPTAPPRLLPEWGFTDSVVSLVGQARANGAEALYNPFAAVPSMHVGFALMIGVAGARLVRPRGLKVAWALYPALVTAVVLVTANHFWLDAVLGALVAAVSAYSARVALGRARSEGFGGQRAVGAEAAA